MESEDEETASSGCVTETDDDDSTASSTNGDSLMSTPVQNSNAEQTSRVVVEKTELEPILEDEVLEIEPTPATSVAPVPVNEEHQNGGCNGTSTMPCSTPSSKPNDLPPVYEEEELADGKTTPHYSQYGGETASLMAPFDDAISITTSTDFHRQKSSIAGCHHPDFMNRLLLSSGRLGGEEDDDAPNLPYQGAPNGGYGWVITLISFITFLVAEGAFYSFGVFFPVFARVFKESDSTVAWVGSVACGSCHLVGPVSSILVDKFGLRSVAIGGCVVSASSLAASIFAPSIYALMFTWGFGFGMGCTVSTIPCHFGLSLWFDTRRGLATGIGIAGGGLGSVIFPPLVSLIIVHYNWKLAMFFLTLSFVFLTFFVAFIKPVPSIPLPDSHMSLSDIVEQNDMNVFHNPGRLRLQAFRKAAFSINSTANNSMWRLSQENVTGGQTSVNDIATIGRSQFSLDHSQMHLGSTFFEKPEPDKKLSSYSNFMQHFLWNQNRKPGRFGVAEDLNGSQNVQETSIGNSKAENINKTPNPTASPGIDLTHLDASPDKVPDINKEVDMKVVPPRRPLRRLDIFYSGSTLNLERAPRSIINLNRSQWTFMGRSHMEQIVDLGSIKTSKDANETSAVSSKPAVVNSLLHLLNIKLMKQISFSMFLLAYFVFMLGFFIPFVFLPPLVADSLPDVTLRQANIFIPMIGVTNTVGRLVMGVVGGMGLMDPCYLNAICFLACGVSTFLIPFFCYSYTAFVIYALCFGFFCSAVSCIRSLALVSLVGLENLTSGFGLVLFVQGIASLLGLPLASIIGDVFGSSKSLFIAASFVYLLAGLISIPLKPVAVWEIRRFQREQALSELEAEEELASEQEKEAKRRHLEVKVVIGERKISNSKMGSQSLDGENATEETSVVGSIVADKFDRLPVGVSITEGLNEECNLDEREEKSMS